MEEERNNRTPALRRVGHQNFEKVVLMSESPVVVAFLATWSRACVSMESVLDEVSRECTETGTLFVAVDTDEKPSLSVWYEVRSLPTILFFRRGTIAARLVGMVAMDVLRRTLDSVLHDGSAKPHAFES